MNKKKIVKKIDWFKYLGLLLIISLAFWIRSYKLDLFQNIKNDELSWIIPGKFLIEKKIPKSWTMFWGVYEEYKAERKEIELGGEKILVVEPFLDHPPVFSILFGLWGKLSKSVSENVLNWGVVRIPMIVIAIYTIILTAILAFKLFDDKTGLLTLISYIFLPTHILSSRTIAAEHLLSSLLVSTLILYLEIYNKKEINKIYLLILTLIIFISPLIKLSGIIIPAIIISLFLKEKGYKKAVYFGWVTLMSFLSLIIYASYYNLELFWQILNTHSGRKQSFWHFFTIFSKPDLGNYEILDSFFLIGIVISFMILVSKKIKLKTKSVWLGIWIFVGLILMVIAPYEGNDWYRYICFPWVAMALGFAWKELSQGIIYYAILIIPGILAMVENVMEILGREIVKGKILILILTLPLITFHIWPKLIKTNFYQVWWKTLLILSCSYQLWWTYLIIDKL